MTMTFDSLASLVATCEKDNLSFSELAREIDCRQNAIDSIKENEKMRLLWDDMKSAADDYNGNLFSSSFLTGGDGKKFESYVEQHNPICGQFTGEVITCALQMAESNACMKRIVAAPTAGSCGVLPAVLIPLYREKKFSDTQIVESLFTSAGIGQVIANRASISGAEGGCQAEIGAASAMAAGTLVFLYNGTPSQIMYAVGFALQNLLGLVCDPVAGLVEVPCVKRNVIGALNACSCADMALAGLTPKIPADEVIDALKEVGNKMDSSLKETGKGGMAATPTAKIIQQKISAQTDK
jgi:L-serine dehydratase